jgi:hypothetical protein
MHNREEWTKGQTGDHFIKGKKYRNLTEFYRPCQSCGKPFSVFVTQKVADGHADSNSFGLKNCEEHRRQKPAEAPELSQLRTYKATTDEELQALYDRNKELFEELQVCKARLAQYELASAMAAIGCEPVQNTSNGVAHAPAAEPLTFPWDKH